MPHLSGKEIVHRLEKLGFASIRQKGSHIVMHKGSQGCVVPNHREVKIGTLSGILKQAGVTSDEFMQIN